MLSAGFLLSKFRNMIFPADTEILKKSGVKAGSYRKKPDYPAHKR